MGVATKPQTEFKENDIISQRNALKIRSAVFAQKNDRLSKFDLSSEQNWL
jgi:hypothetical protein